ncbi:hypothetical protein H2199_004887 [Coniosporium tulheliwenetii]|uniref:Uncharacterized protein n=1 Tax=Coniosporium tulheliwenetii TaxID=3383036 RepID=A0ACC2Z4B6_9PEZI|nr:hypothetical protein H2199_004887 [Cladosporium sp. JES 115]
MNSLNELGLCTTFDPIFGFDDLVNSEECASPALDEAHNANPVDGGHGDDVPQDHETASPIDGGLLGADFDLNAYQNIDGNDVGAWGTYISPELLQPGTYSPAGSPLPDPTEDENYASFAPAAEQFNPALDDGTIDPADIHESVEYDDNKDDDDDEDKGEGEEVDEVDASSPPPSDDEYASDEEEELAPPPSPTASPSPAATAASEPEEEPKGCCGFCDAPDTETMVACENGPPHHAEELWYHFSCVGETAESLAAIDDWICPQCVAGESESSSKEDLPSSPAAPAASTKVKKKVKDAPKRRAWSKDEDRWCMLELPRIDAELKRAGNHRIDDLWKKVSECLTKKYGMTRVPNAVRNQWIRRLRFVSGHDERRAANPGRMRTSLLSNKKRKASGGSDDATTSTTNLSAPATKKRKTASTPARPATSSSAPTSSASKPTSSAPTSAARISSANTSFADDAPPASPAASSEREKSSSPQSRPTLGGKNLFGTRPPVSGKTPPSSTVSGKYLPGTRPTVSGKRPPGTSAVSGKGSPGTSRKAPVSSGATQQASPIQQAPITQQARSNPFNSRKRRAASISDDDDDDDDDDDEDSDISDAYNEFITQQPPKKVGNTQPAKKKQRRSSTTKISTLKRHDPHDDSHYDAEATEIDLRASGIMKYTPFDPSYTYDVPPPASTGSGGAGAGPITGSITGTTGAGLTGARSARKPGAGLGRLAESILGGTGAGTIGAGHTGVSASAAADTTTAAPGESDEDFAKRLDAESNSSGAPGASRASRRAGGRK